MKGCAVAGGELIEAQYAKPLPWIGLYVAAASLLCGVAVALDAYSGFRRLNLWFPCRLFSLNAAILALLGVATKFPVDLNTAMPRAVDQLTKLSSTVLLSAAMGNLLPSLGQMSGPELLSNVIALAILVVTVVVNICIQMGTGVIYVFLPEHAAVVVFLMILLLIFICSAIAVPSTKEQLEKLYDSKFLDVAPHSQAEIPLHDLQMRVKKYWLMAHTGSPQHVLGRSATCTASGFLSLLAAGVLIEALLRGHSWKSSLRLCGGTSDYAWSSGVVLITQSTAVLFGTVAPAFRWYYALKFRTPNGGGSSWKEACAVEGYWVQQLQSWKESPLPLNIGRKRKFRKTIHRIMSNLMGLLIFLQKWVVRASKLFRLVSGKPVSLIGRHRLSRSPSSVQNGVYTELRDFVLRLEGEEDLVRLIVRSERKDTERWIEKGRRKNPAAMVELIQSHSTFQQGFTEVCSFDSQRAPPPAPEEPPNCWGLPLVTLAAVATALPVQNPAEVESLRRAVGEGLLYVRLVEKHLDEKGLMNMRDAADVIWLNVDLYNRWMEEDLRRRESSGRKALEKVRDAAAECERRLSRETIDREPLEWPQTLLAANCMARVCRTVLQEYDSRHGGDDERLLSWLQAAIADILGACLTNLPRAISMECICSKVEVREKTVRDAARILGETEQVLRLLEDPKVVSLLPQEKRYIDGWRRDV